MPRILAHFISYFLHPILMPTYVLLIFFYYDSLLFLNIPFGTRKLIFSIIFIVTCLFPLVATLALLKFGIISNIHMQKREERIVPFFITLVFYGFGYYVLAKIGVSRILLLLLIGSMLAIFCAIIISFYWKISIHLIGIGGLMGALVIIFSNSLHELQVPLMAAIIIAGLVGSARLAVQSHTNEQVYSGLLLGLVSVIVPFYIF